MQTEIHSYSFPLFDRAENAFVAPYKTKHLLIAGVRTNGKSVLNRFSYEDENLKKSAGINKEIEGRIVGLAVGENNSEHLAVLISQNEGQSYLQKVKSQAFGNEEEPVCQILHKDEETISSLAIKRDNSCIYLSTSKEIKMFDVEKQRLSGAIAHKQQRNNHLTLDPNFQNPTIVAASKEVIIFDRKSSSQKYSIKGSAVADIISIDYNPNKQYNLMTCHHESIKFWDVRKGNIPFKIYDDHHNLLTQATYNHSHDELIACAYDDGSVGLLRLVSASSSQQGEAEDALVKLYDEHQDSVLRVQWTRCSPWIFASIASNPTQLVLNIVPSAQKYRILL